MEIVSTPAFVLEPWTDLAIGQTYGEPKEFTLKRGDKFVEQGDLLEVTMVGRGGDPTVIEHWTFRLPQTPWLCRRLRMVAVDPATGKPVIVPPSVT